MTGPIAFTGATGFIGTSLLKELCGLNLKIRALTRRPRTDDANIQWITGDMHNLESLKRLVQGVHAVIHCAGVVRGHTRDEFVHANVEGTTNLMGLLTELDPHPHLLFISSLAAREPQLSWYASSKRLAEQQVIQRSGTMPWTIFRPTAVYGPGDRELKPLFRTMQRGILPVIGDPENRISLLYIDDLVAAIKYWITAPNPVRGTYELADGTAGGYDYYGLAGIAREVWRKPVRVIPFPAVIAYLIAGMNLMLAKIFRYAPMLTPGKVRELTHPDWRCDNAAVEQAMPGWHPQVRFREGLPRSA